MKKNINKIIAFDTVAARMSIALCDKGILLEQKESFDHRKHSEQLFIDLLAVMEKHTWKDKPDLIAVDIGPGSFTGIRVGVSAARALAQSWDIPLIGVKSLDVLAHAVGPFKGIICAVIDALKGEIYHAQYTYDKRLERITDYSLISVDELIHLTSPNPALSRVEGACPGPVEGPARFLFIGSGAFVHQEKIKKIFGARTVWVSDDMNMPSAEHVALCALEMYPCMKDTSYTCVEPFYIRRPAVEERMQKIT